MTSHDRIQRQLPAFAAGLLPEEQEAVVEAHLAQCAECRERAAVLAVDPPGSGIDRAHVPAGVLARWPQASRELRGLERELVAAHLVNCEECRGALAVLGYSPELAAATLPITAAPSRASGHEVSRRRELALAVWATLATAAAFVFALAPEWISPGPSLNHATPLPPPSATQTPAPGPAKPLAPAGIPATTTISPLMASLGHVAIGGLDRGAGLDTTVIRSRRGEWTLLSTPLLSAPAPWIRVSLLDSRDSVLFVARLRGDELIRNGVLLNTSAPGERQLTLRLKWTSPEGLEQTRDYALRITD